MVTSGLAMDLRYSCSWHSEYEGSDNVSGTASCAAVKQRNVF